MMIEKVEVRRQLALYENKIREEIKSIREEMQAMNESCTTTAMKEIWLESEKYTKLSTRIKTLSGVLSDVIDIRCSEIFED